MEVSRLVLFRANVHSKPTRVEAGSIIEAFFNKEGVADSNQAVGMVKPIQSATECRAATSTMRNTKPV